MTQLSRRSFLHVAGLTLVGTSFDPAFRLMQSLLPDTPTLYGRVLGLMPVYRANGTTVLNVWQDSVMEILDTEGDLYHVNGGYMSRSALQPMTVRPTPARALPSVPFWAEVVAPVAAVRQSCAADSPLVTRIGHAGVARVIDRLEDGRGGEAWLGLESERGALLGWSQVSRWQPVDEQQPTSSGDHTLDVSLDAQTLTAYENGDVVLTTSISTAPTGVVPGIYRVGDRIAGGSYHGEMLHEGVPWITTVPELGQIAGVYWHNAFGAPAPGPAIQVSPLVARWLYTWLNDLSTITVA